MPVLTPPQFTNTFTGSPIYPSQISGLEVVLTEDTTFAWPFAPGNNPYPLAAILDVFTDSAVLNPPLDPAVGFKMLMPPANEASPFQSAFIRNRGPLPAPVGTSDLYPIQVCDNAGNLIVSIPGISGLAVGQAVYLYLTSNEDAQGTWQYIFMGVGSSTADAAALAGNGLEAIGDTLNENTPITFLTTEERPFVASDRARLLVWTETTNPNFTLPDVTTRLYDNGFFFSLSNQRAGTTVTLTPAPGQLINGQKSFILRYGDSVTVVSAGFVDNLHERQPLNWFTISGQASNISTFYSAVTIDLANQTSPYTESADAGNSQIQVFENTGAAALVQPFYVVFPLARSYEYFINNNTKSTISFYVIGGDQTKAIPLVQGASAVLFINGTNIYTTSSSQSITALNQGDNILLTPTPIETVGTISLQPEIALTSVEVAQGGGIIFDDTQTTPQQITLTAPATVSASYGVTLPQDPPDPNQRTVLTSVPVDNVAGPLQWIAPSGVVVSSITALAPLVASSPTGDVTLSLADGLVPVDKGGTGSSSFAAYGAIIAGSTSTSPFLSVIPPTSWTQDLVLTLTGLNTAPIWKAPSGGSGGVTSLLAGQNIGLSPTSGTGAVTVSVTGVLPVSLGGTGYSSIPSTHVGGVSYVASTSSYASTTQAEPGLPLVAGAKKPGTGQGNEAPSFQVLTVKGGGTGLSILISGGVLYADTTTNVACSAGTLTPGLPFLSGGTSPPTWGVLGISGGGTGATTQTTAFNALSPMTTSGDMIYGGVSGMGTRLPKGTEGQVLSMASGIPSWNSVGQIPSPVDHQAQILQSDGMNTFWGTQIRDSENTIVPSTLMPLANLGIGYQALQANRTGTENSAFGWVALSLNTASGNSAFGSSTLANNITGIQNSAFGGLALAGNDASDNSAFGYQALNINTTGYSNTAVGSLALQANYDGHENCAFGYLALGENVEGHENCAFGSQALKVNTASRNSAFGYEALQANTTGSNNCAFGISALSNNRTGINNTAVGSLALATNYLGHDNSAFGYLALTKNFGTASFSLESHYNSAFGSEALAANTTGSFNSAFGAQALKANAAGHDNSAFGYLALTDNNIASQNSAFGSLALKANTTGTNNCAFGGGSLSSITTGSFNSAFGAQANTSNANLNHTTCLGYNAIANQSHEVILGGPDNYLVYPNVSIGKSASSSSLDYSLNIYSSYYMANPGPQSATIYLQESLSRPTLSSINNGMVLYLDIHDGPCILWEGSRYKISLSSVPL